MIDPLLDAVETLSTLVDRLRQLRRKGETAKGQIEAMDQLIDETIETIMSLLARIPETPRVRDSVQRVRLRQCTSHTAEPGSGRGREYRTGAHACECDDAVRDGSDLLKEGMCQSPDRLK